MAPAFSRGGHRVSDHNRCGSVYTYDIVPMQKCHCDSDFGMVLCLLPVIIGQVGSGNLAGWIRCILPTGGLGLGNCFLYELFDFKFLHLGRCV